MDLKALFLNCTLKKSPETSHTQALIDKVAGLMEPMGVECETVRLVDYKIAFGVESDMEHQEAYQPRMLANAAEAIARHAAKLTSRPTEMTEGDLAGLRAHGLGDLELVDLNNLVGYYNYINRVVMVCA